MTVAALGIDVGGTKIACGFVAADGTCTRVARADTPPGGDEDALWAALTGLVDGVAAGVAYDGVGVGCGGPMQLGKGRVSPLNIPGWREFPLLDRVRERYGSDGPVRLHNDAVAFASAEARWGAGRAASHVLGVVVSTGVGAGIVLDGRRVDGATGNAGHLGHLVVEPDGPPCACGGQGCLEAVARGPAIAAAAVGRGWTGEPSAAAVAAGARAGDPACLAAFDRAGRALGTALAGAVALLELDVVVVGGGVAQAGELLLGPARQAYDHHARLAFTRRCEVVGSALGPDGGVAGAAALVLDDLAPPPRRSGGYSRYWDTDWAAPRR